MLPPTITTVDMAGHQQLSPQIKVLPVSTTIAEVAIATTLHLLDNARMGSAVGFHVSFQEVAMKQTDRPNDTAAQYAVPADFPRPGVASSVAGFQSKLPLVAYHGKYYLPGATPPELFGRWDICEDLAQQFVPKCRESKAGKRSHMSETAILDQYLPRLLKTGWGSDEEMRWVIRRTAEMLGWPVPKSAAAAVGTGQ